jgi:hypothetical protein
MIIITSAAVIDFGRRAGPGDVYVTPPEPPTPCATMLVVTEVNTIDFGRRVGPGDIFVEPPVIIPLGNFMLFTEINMIGFGRRSLGQAPVIITPEPPVIDYSARLGGHYRPTTWPSYKGGKLTPRR